MLNSTAVELRKLHCSVCLSSVEIPTLFIYNSGAKEALQTTLSMSLERLHLVGERRQLFADGFAEAEAVVARLNFDIAGGGEVRSGSPVAIRSVPDIGSST